MSRDNLDTRSSESRDVGLSVKIMTEDDVEQVWKSLSPNYRSASASRRKDVECVDERVVDREHEEARPRARRERVGLDLEPGRRAGGLEVLDLDVEVLEPELPVREHVEKKTSAA